MIEDANTTQHNTTQLYPALVSQLGHYFVNVGTVQQGTKGETTQRMSGAIPTEQHTKSMHAYVFTGFLLFSCCINFLISSSLRFSLANPCLSGPFSFSCCCFLRSSSVISSTIMRFSFATGRGLELSDREGRVRCSARAEMI